MAYHFVDLTEDQKYRRRELLDYYATLAQVSVLVPLLLLQSYFLASWINRRRRQQIDSKPPSSPYAKESRRSSNAGKVSFASALRQAQWWLGDSLDLAGYHVGTKGEVIGASLWAAWLVLLCFLETGDDYLHLTKRFGIVAASQLPFHYLLALKSPFSPLQVVTRSSHETLNILHQLLGRIITLLLYSHAILYINFYVLAGLLAAKLREFYVLAGVFGIIAFTAIGTTALAPLRKWSYRVFYAVHVVLATALLPLLFFHVSHIRIYLYETAAIYAINVVLRTLASKTYSGSIEVIPHTSLIEINLPFPSSHAGYQRTHLRQWQPGQHAYLSLAGHPLLRTFRSNPFTLASLPSVDGSLRFVARILDGNTRKLAETTTSPKSSPKTAVTIEGPYGVATHSDELLQYDRVLFLAGGIGATFIVPLYRQLLMDLTPGKGTFRRQKVSFVWSVRSKSEILWAFPTEEKEREGFVERLKVHVTGREGSISLGQNAGGVGESEEGIELEEQKQLLPSHHPYHTTNKEHRQGIETSLTISAGRPNLSRTIDELFSHGSHERIAVVVCGPRSLSQSLRKELRRWVWRDREVWFWEESFNL